MNDKVTLPKRLRLVSLGLRNFMSYGNNVTVVKLDQPGTTFIVGQDLDNTTNGTGSNGVGKTTILNAVVYALYNRALSEDVTVDGLINNINKKNLEVTLDFTIGDMCYRIVRARKMKSGPSGNYVMFYQRGGDFEFTDSDDVSKGHSVYNTDDDIEAVIGMKFEMFTRIVVFSAMKEPFFNLPLRSHGTSKKANQTDFIEELFGLTELSDKAEELKNQTKDVTKRLSEVQLEIQYQEKEHARYADQLASAERRVDGWFRQRDSQISEIEGTLEEYKDFDFHAQIEARNREKELELEVRDLDRKDRALAKQLATIIRTKSTSTDEMALLVGDQCPYCLQKFADNLHKIEECNNAIADANVEIEQIQLMQQQLAVTTDSVIAAVEALSATIINPGMGISALEGVQRTVEAGLNEITKLHNSVNPFIEPLDELKRTEIQAVDYTEINNLTKKLEHHEFLYKLLTKKDSFVRRNLLNKNLPFLNQKLQEYLTELGLAHKVEFTHELTAKITQFGRELSFGNLSAGQKARVNIALSFAFRDVLQSMHTPVNICMLDEILDVGLNGGGVQMAVRMLKRKAREEKLSMYVISHREDIDSAFDRTLTVQMSKGFSYIFVDDGGQPLTND